MRRRDALRESCDLFRDGFVDVRSGLPMMLRAILVELPLAIVRPARLLTFLEYGPDDTYTTIEDEEDGYGW